jgi:DNA polymerase III delta subunit
LASEIEKLRYWKERSGQSITSEVVEEVTFGITEADSFKFFDHLFADPKKACQILDDMQSDGDDRNQIVGLLYWGLKNYLIVLDFEHQGIRDSKTIASEAKLNPRQVGNMLKQSNVLIAKEYFIKNFFKKLIELDYDIKMGHVPGEYFWLAVKELVLKG